MEERMDQALTASVRRWTAECDVDLAGVADLGPAPEAAFAALPRRFPRAVAMALRLQRAVLDTCVDGPTPLYFHHYRQANYHLDWAALIVANRLQRAGHEALALPASQVIGENPMRGHLSHRAVAEAAGIGWRGRSGLLVTPQFGAHVRLVTVLTDAPLVPGPLREEGRVPPPADADAHGLRRGCGNCRKCVGVCPAHAIGETAAEHNLEACYALLSTFRKRPFIGQHICGLCVRVCDGRR